MHAKLIIVAFKEAEKRTGSMVVKRLAEHLSDFVLEDSGQTYGERRLRDLYNTAIGQSDEVIELKQFVVQALCNYLGYKDFVEFTNNQDQGKGTIQGKPKSDSQSATRRFIRKYWAALLIILMAGTVFTIDSLNSPRFMVWDKDHYKEAPFDVDTYSLKDLKVYNADRIKNFKKVSLECGSTFFKMDGSPIVWYGKNKKGELEYFTTLGKHPETGKSLKEITKYMIEKHICDSYNE